MTVAELIEELQRCDPKAEVKVSERDSDIERDPEIRENNFGYRIVL